MAFKGKPPGSGSGEMSRRTVALRPAIDLPPRQRDEARRLRRAGHEPAQIAEAIGAPVEEVEKALVQMRMPRPETTRGTLNVTLAAHALVMKERQGNEPLWQTMDRLLDELLRHRSAEAARGRRRREDSGALPLFPEGWPEG
jgi:hypothetical protein